MNARTVESLISENSALKIEGARLARLLADATYQLEWLKRQIYGQKSERSIPVNDTQCTLDMEGVVTTQPTVTTETVTYSRKRPNANKTPHMAGMRSLRISPA
jgi:hypothetical protein